MIPSPSELYQSYRLAKKKRFGQHFLTNPSILSSIVECGNLSTDDFVLEIGPGCGTLSATILQLTKNLTAIEIDDDAAAFLQNNLVPCGLSLIHQDALKTDLETVTSQWRDAKCIANLPYNVATPLTLRLLDCKHFSRYVLMYQREVAERLTALPGTSSYGSLSVAVQMRATAKTALTLPPGAFSPPPKVHSAVVVLVPHSPDNVPDNLERREAIIRTAFQQRRKTLMNSLGRAGFDKEQIREILATVDAPEKARPEELSVPQWISFTDQLL